MTKRESKAELIDWKCVRPHEPLSSPVSLGQRRARGRRGRTACGGGLPPSLDSGCRAALEKAEARTKGWPRRGRTKGCPLRP
jgi:hypothetical protein